MGELGTGSRQFGFRNLLTNRHATFSVIFLGPNPTCNPSAFDPHGTLLSLPTLCCRFPAWILMCLHSRSPWQVSLTLWKTAGMPELIGCLDHLLIPIPDSLKAAPPASLDSPHRHLPFLPNVLPTLVNEACFWRGWIYGLPGPQCLQL